MADVGVSYTLTTPSGTVTFNDGSADQFYITEIQGLEGTPVRAPIDDVPFGDGGIVHDFWEGPRHITVDGVFFITSTQVMDNVVVIRNQMEETLRTALRSIMRTDATFVWTPQGQSARTLNVRNDVQYDSTHTDGYLLETFHFGLVAADPDWDGFVSAPDWSDIFNARNGLLVDFWSALHDYSADLVVIYPPWGTGSGGDIIQFLRPTGFTDIFAAEVQSGNLTDSVEPDWATVPNPYDSIADGDLTWFNCGTLAELPDIVAWKPDWFYDSNTPVISTAIYPVNGVIPTTANGHAYVTYPNLIGPSASVEPTFPTDGSSVGDNACTWLDMGPVP